MEKLVTGLFYVALIIFAVSAIQIGLGNDISDTLGGGIIRSFAIVIHVITHLGDYITLGRSLG